MKRQAKQHPIPTRFHEQETAFLESTAQRYGIPVSEIVRRSVRLMKRTMSQPHSEKLILELVA